MWLLLLTLTASGCESVGRGIECAGFRPILLSRDDRLTRGTEDAVLAHNEFGERRGCWKAPK